MKHSILNRPISGLNNNKERLTPSKRVSSRILATVLGGVFVALGLLLVACPASTSGGGNTTYGYICNNGAPVAGNDATADNITRCESCNNDYTLVNDTCLPKYTCTNGTAVDGTTDADDTERCTSCISGYRLTEAEICTKAYNYICNNGTPVAGNDATADNVTQCESCITGYFVFNQTCLLNSDDDNDGVLRSNDVDDDNDGLIEVHNLTMLHNMRYNLAGTSYKTSSAGTGSTTGAPTSATTNCGTATGSVYLCGYELTHGLTFDTGTDGTFTKENGTYRLDSKDHNATYFPVSSGAGGWLPIGDNTNAFTAIFEGNGNTITGLAIKRNQTYVGMFGYINTGAHIRNVGLVANLADYNGSSNNSIYIGGLVGYQDGGSITASYATGNADGGDGGNDFTGGLVGRQQGGSITASYATGNADGGDGGNDFTGGLAGYQANGSITASYATGSADGGIGNYDRTGGLLGYQENASITASYAMGNADGGAGVFDYTGGLVGQQQSGSITASYATGNADGGTGTGDYVGMLIGFRGGGSYSASYGFGTKNGENNGIDGTSKPAGVTTAAGLTAANAGTSGSTQIWNSATNNTAGAWDFGTSSQAPAIKYSDYDGSGNDYSCNQFPSNVTCGTTLLPGQRN